MVQMAHYGEPSRSITTNTIGDAGDSTVKQCEINYLVTSRWTQEMSNASAMVALSIHWAIR
jgi:hypothetical protein